MGKKVVKVDFVTRERVKEEASSKYPVAAELRGAEGFERTELIERTAVVIARLALAKQAGDELELQDLGNSLQEHGQFITPELTQKEIDAINKRADQIIDELISEGE